MIVSLLWILQIAILLYMLITPGIILWFVVRNRRMTLRIGKLVLMESGRATEDTPLREIEQLLTAPLPPKPRPPSGVKKTPEDQA